MQSANEGWHDATAFIGPNPVRTTPSTSLHRLATSEERIARSPFKCRARPVVAIPKPSAVTRSTTALVPLYPARILVDCDLSYAARGLNSPAVLLRVLRKVRRPPPNVAAGSQYNQIGRA